MVLCMNLLHQHVRDTVIILEEGNSSHTQCPCCDMLVPGEVLNGRYPNTAQYAKGVERKQRRLAAVDMRASTERAFWEYGRPLTSVS